MNNKTNFNATEPITGQGKQKRNLLMCPSCGASQGSFVLEAEKQPQKKHRVSY